LKQRALIEKPLSAILIDDTKVGAITVAASDVGLAYVSFYGLQDFTAFIGKNVSKENSKALKIAQEAARQIQEYFDQKRKVFEVPLDLDGITDFRRRVLLETKNIPYGRTLTYGQLAARVHQPNAARAVGGAMAGNPLPLIVPCHRVVASDGSMHGFSSPGGIKTKVALLEHEGLNINNNKLAAY
jgi:methylated-DNA-[protein]-cysteine S-methyltransferase